MKSPTFFRLTFFLLWLGLFSVSHVYSQTAHCFSPGVLVLNDAAGDTPLGAYDIQSIHAAEPAYGDGSQKIVFTLKVQDLLALPAVSWNVVFTGPDSVTRYVQMNNLAGNTQFKYGRVTTILGIPIFTEDGTIAGTFDTNGTITLSIDKSLIGSPAPGQALRIGRGLYFTTRQPDLGRHYRPGPIRRPRQRGLHAVPIYSMGHERQHTGAKRLQPERDHRFCGMA